MTALQIQQQVNLLRRQICEIDQMFLKMLAQRREIEAALREAAGRYQDTLNAGRLAEQGAAAVRAAEELIGG
jgi:hypothetical protein